jgi:hypothetical protein
MSAPRSIDELNRAAAAAGFAMAGMDDEPATTARTTAPRSAVSVEDSARGARQVAAAAPSSDQTAARAILPAGANTLRAGANSVRDTLYGYLGFGVPA